MKKWNVDNMPNLNGKNIIITGSTSGIGYEAALEFAKRDANVYIAARNKEKALKCISKIKEIYSKANVEFISLDVSNVTWVKEFAIEWSYLNKKIDILVLNAGVYNIPTYEETVDGFERQLATNYLGHFLLTGLLLKYMNDNSRIITLSSLSHTWENIHFNDINLKNEYAPVKAYAQSKLANLMFALELDKRLKEANLNIISVAAHPGISNTGLTRCGDTKNVMRKFFNKIGFAIAGQSAKKGAWPILYAATSTDIQGGKYYGPSKLKESRGYPKESKIGSAALVLDDRTKLWRLSEGLVEFEYDFMIKEK